MITKSKPIKKLEKIRNGRLKFSELLVSLRETEELTQVEVAKKVGTTKSKICDYEKERRLPSLEQAAKLAKAFGHSEALFVAKVLEEQIIKAKLDLKIKVEAA